MMPDFSYHSILLVVIDDVYVCVCMCVFSVFLGDDMTYLGWYRAFFAYNNKLLAIVNGVCFLG